MISFAVVSKVEELLFQDMQLYDDVFFAILLQAAVADGEAPPGLPMKKSGTAPSVPQSGVCALIFLLPCCGNSCLQI